MSRFSGIILFGLCIVLILYTGCITPVENRNVSITSPATPAPATQISVSPSFMATTLAPTPFVENSTPWIHVDPVALNHIVGDLFTLTGTTNLKSGDRVALYIYPSFAWNCGSMTETAVVSPGNGSVNTWSFSDVNLTKTLPPCHYIIDITDANNTVPAEEAYYNIVSKTDR
jgi:hypothetical protein